MCRCAARNVGWSGAASSGDQKAADSPGDWRKAELPAANGTGRRRRW